MNQKRIDSFLNMNERKAIWVVAELMVCSFTHQDASADREHPGDVCQAWLRFIYTCCRSCWFDVDQGGWIHRGLSGPPEAITAPRSFFKRTEYWARKASDWLKWKSGGPRFKPWFQQSAHSRVLEHQSRTCCLRIHSIELLWSGIHFYTRWHSGTCWVANASIWQVNSIFLYFFLLLINHWPPTLQILIFDIRVFMSGWCRRSQICLRRSNLLLSEGRHTAPDILGAREHHGNNLPRCGFSWSDMCHPRLTLHSFSPRLR